MNGEEVLGYDPDANDARREQILRVAAACPMQAIHVDRMATQHRGMRTGPVVSPPVGDGFRKTGRIVIVGASLAGARAAGVLRRGPWEEDRAERERQRQSALLELGRYLGELAAERRKNPDDDLLSGLVTYEGPDGAMSPVEVVVTATPLLIAGHETTVNLITNGMLTLLRHPELIHRLRHEPDLIIYTVEELLRYEPPVHFLSSRVALDDIEIAGTTIPKGAPIALALAAGSRDPEHVPEPDRFIPDRRYNEHLGFGGGVHYCFGAPLARLEAQIALTELARRLRNPRLVTDPPPYRTSPTLRGPRHLLIDIEGVAD